MLPTGSARVKSWTCCSDGFLGMVSRNLFQQKSYVGSLVSGKAGGMAKRYCLLRSNLSRHKGSELSARKMCHIPLALLPSMHRGMVQINLLVLPGPFRTASAALIQFRISIRAANVRSSNDQDKSHQFARDMEIPLK